MDVLDSLRQQIKLWELPPGAWLSEVELVESFGVDPLVIRHALEQLVLEDLARFYPGRGAFVAEVSPPDLIELFQMREALESASAKLAAEGVREGKAARTLGLIRADIQGLGVQVGEAQSSAFQEMSCSAKREIAILAGNQKLMLSLEDLWEQSARVDRLLWSDKSHLIKCIEGCLEIIDAVLDGDGDRARTATARRVMQSREAIIAAVAHSVRGR